jgi:large subunit ribosomal protein L24
MRIKKNDNVIVIAGKDRGKTGKVTRAFPRTGEVIISGVNTHKIHKRPNKTNQKGQILEQSFPINVSNVMILDPKTNKGTRIGYSVSAKDKVRVAKKSGTTIK